MEHKISEIKTVQSVVDITCDCCGESLREKPDSNFCGIHFCVEGNYDSKYFPDVITNSNVVVDVCEKCSVEWFKLFKRNPLDVIAEENGYLLSEEIMPKE